MSRSIVGLILTHGHVHQCRSGDFVLQPQTVGVNMMPHKTSRVHWSALRGHIASMGANITANITAQYADTESAAAPTLAKVAGLGAKTGAAATRPAGGWRSRPPCLRLKLSTYFCFCRFAASAACSSASWSLSDPAVVGRQVSPCAAAGFHQGRASRLCTRTLLQPEHMTSTRWQAFERGEVIRSTGQGTATGLWQHNSVESPSPYTDRPERMLSMCSCSRTSCTYLRTAAPGLPSAYQRSPSADP